VRLHFGGSCIALSLLCLVPLWCASPGQELVAAALWWLGASSVVFDARVRRSLWADWTTEHEMGHMCSAFYSVYFPFLFLEIHFIT
jgi:hypothetical protein